tara:strand:+ start:124 stop:390 length:267 start_codon:yes stop_codon:yes gene_type:complete
MLELDMARKPLDDIADATFAFRLSQSEKEELAQTVNELRERFNQKIPDEEYRVTKNEVILAALKVGLTKLKLKDLPERRLKNDPGTED